MINTDWLGDLLLMGDIIAILTKTSIPTDCWEGELQREAEVLLLIKTTVSRYSDLESYISEYHPYDVPEIIRIPVTAGLSGYLDWLRTTTASDRRE